MEFGNDTTDTTNFCPRQLFRDLFRTCHLCWGLITGKSPTCCGLVSVVANKSATSCCNGIWEMTRLFARANLFYELVVDLPFTWGLVSNTMWKSPTCYGLATGKLVQWILAFHHHHHHHHYPRPCNDYSC